MKHLTLVPKEDTEVEHTNRAWQIAEMLLEIDTPPQNTTTTTERRNDDGTER